MKRVWVLDVDGPVTDPERKRIVEPALIDELLLRLVNEEPVALNTGRDVGWVLNRVVAPLRYRAKVLGLDPNALCTNLIVVGEKGGVVATTEQADTSIIWRDPALTVPLELQGQVARLAENSFSDIMAVDVGKETMMSIEMRDGVTVADYTPRQQEFVEAVTALRDSLGLDANTVRIDATRIAVDLQDPRAGKGLGADRILTWLAHRGVVAGEFTCVGDSASDAEMADRFHAAGYRVRYVDVGATDVTSSDYVVERSADAFGVGTVRMFAADRARRPELSRRAAAIGMRLPSAPADGRAVA